MHGPTIHSNIAIRISDVAYAYSPTAPEPTLQGVSLDSTEGEFLCLLGPSGCGKTTVLRLIAGFDVPSAGEIWVNGNAVHGPDVDRGVVFQGDDSLFNWLTAADNVAFGAKMRGMSRAERTEIAERFLALVGLEGHGHKFPSELSGGMRQRIQIARVLANDPQILLMDKPFGALDAQTRAELQDELVRIWEATKKTVVFITHDIGEALLLSNRIGIMRRGPRANVREIIEVDLPRPRSRSSVRFGELYELINNIIIEEVKLSRLESRSTNGVGK
jgi:NitT/TauT family transport system ATP-binding protein